MSVLRLQSTYTCVSDFIWDSGGAAARQTCRYLSGHVFNNNYPWQNCIPMFRSLSLAETSLLKTETAVKSIRLMGMGVYGGKDFW